MKKIALALSFLILNLGLVKANDLLNLASNSELKSGRILNNTELASVKGGYYWITGLVDTSGLRHDNLGNVYGYSIARGEVQPDQNDMFWETTYFKIEYEIAMDNPRFSNYRQTAYRFIPYDYKTNKPKVTNDKGQFLMLSEEQMRNIDSKVVYASKAVVESSNAWLRYQSQVISNPRF